MNKAQDLIDQFAPTVESGKRLTTWYAQGHSDGLGDRLLMFDNTSAPSWEILRFKPSLAAEPKFEAALRQRVERLSPFHHPAFPAIRPITELGQEDGLAVVSTYSSAVSLSEGLKKPRSAGFAVRLLRQVVPALAALQQHAPGISHGALTLDRIVLTSEGRLMLREHMVGSALQSLGWPASKLWAEFGILPPSSPTDIPALDERSDLIQLAVIVVSLMVGRRLGPEDFPARMGDLLDDLADRTLWHEPERFRVLRGWLERALQIGERPFESARDANAALVELQDEPERTTDHGAGAIHLPARRAVVPETPGPQPVAASSALSATNADRATVSKGPWLQALRRDPRLIRVAAVAVAVLAISEAAFIGSLLYSPSESKRPVSVAPPATTAPPRAAIPPSDQPKLTPLQLEVAPRTPSTVSMPAPSVASAPAAAAVKAIATPAVRSGGFRIVSPIDIHVLEGERVVGSSADGPIVASAGRHEFEFVNSAIGYRARRVVDIKAGEIASLSLAIPNGTLNINATPWASVWIDGNPYGETPLGNVSVAPGEHEVVFRHPQLGERRERTLVRADTATRVVVSFR